ncbi:MAG: phage integrase N-terminal SAM-like domain-containing protein [Pseudonocardiaceae bacterium]
MFSAANSESGFQEHDPGDGQHRRITSENTTTAFDAYRAALTAAPLSTETARTYLSKVRGYLIWLTDAGAQGDPLDEPRARDWAVRDYRTHLLTVAKRAPATINNALAALDDFYTRRGLGPATTDRLDLPTQAPARWNARRRCGGCAPSKTIPHHVTGC